MWMDYRHVEGGMGTVSMAISNAAREAGAHILTDIEVAYHHLDPYIVTICEVYYC